MTKRLNIYFIKNKSISRHSYMNTYICICMYIYIFFFAPNFFFFILALHLCFQLCGKECLEGCYNTAWSGHEARVAPRPITSHRDPLPVRPAWRRVGSAYLGSEGFALSGSGGARLGPSAPAPGVATAGRGLVLGPDALSRLWLRRVHSGLLARPEPGSGPDCVTWPA